MAKKTRNEVAVGMTVLGVGVLTIYIVVMLADWSTISTPQQKVTVRLPYQVGLKGLGEGSPIHLGGVKIGTIIKTEIKRLKSTATDNDEVYVFFTMKIPREYQLRPDCVLLPQSNVLGGQASLSIECLGSEGDFIMDGQTVDLPLANSMMEALKNEFDSSNPESLMSLMKYEVNRDNNDSVVSSLKNVAVKLEEAIPALTDHMQKTLAKAELTLETAQSTLLNIKKLTEDERIDKILNDLGEVGSNLKLTSREVRRAPWKVLYKPNENEFKIQALVDAAGSFAAGAESLDNSAMRLQRLINSADDEQPIDRDKLNSMMSQMEASFSQFQKAERKFWEELQ